MRQKLAIAGLCLLCMGTGIKGNLLAAEAEESRSVKQIEVQLEQKRNELGSKRREYVQVTNNFKKAARTGFLGFGRTKEEIDNLIAAREKRLEVRQEYIEIKRQIHYLRRDLAQARREAARQK